MAKNSSNIEIISGNTVNIIITILDDNGDPVSLAGLQAASFAVVEEPKGRAALDTVHKIDKALGTGITVTNPSGGVLKVALLPSDTSNLKGDYYYQCNIVDFAGDTSTVAYGLMQIKYSIIPTA